MSNKHAKTEQIAKYKWPKGVSGNPGGRPKKKPITEAYALLADVKIDELPPHIRKRFKNREELSLALNLALGLFLAGGEGNAGAAKEIREGIEGKLTEKIDLTVDVNKDIVERLMAARQRSAKK